MRRARININIELLWQILDMPRDVVLRDVKLDLWSGDHVQLLVESEHLPETQPGQFMPTVIPIYEHAENGHAARMVTFPEYSGRLGYRAANEEKPA